MIKIGLINPNSTEDMTVSCAEQAKKCLTPGFEIVSYTNKTGPRAIQGLKDNKIAEQGTIELAKANYSLDGIIIGCFDDTALEKCVGLISKPVIGLGQASYYMSHLKSGFFSVLTTMEDSVPIIQNNISRLGFNKWCLGVYASNLEVLALEYEQERSVAILKERIKKITEFHGPHSIALGCAGMTKVFKALNKTGTAPLIDPIKASVSLMVALINTTL
tara:strand:- start:808 stop:1461 length:654 start_codon:yes stop_codon:yes gene_type:complete